MIFVGGRKNEVLSVLKVVIMILLMILSMKMIWMVVRVSQMARKRKVMMNAVVRAAGGVIGVRSVGVGVSVGGSFKNIHKVRMSRWRHNQRIQIAMKSTHQSRRKALFVCRELCCLFMLFVVLLCSVLCVIGV